MMDLPATKIFCHRRHDRRPHILGHGDSFPLPRLSLAFPLMFAVLSLVLAVKASHRIGAEIFGGPSKAVTSSETAGDPAGERGPGAPPKDDPRGHRNVPGEQGTGADEESTGEGMEGAQLALLSLPAAELRQGVTVFPLSFLGIATEAPSDPPNAVLSRRGTAAPSHFLAPRHLGHVPFSPRAPPGV